MEFEGALSTQEHLSSLASEIAEHDAALSALYEKRGRCMVASVLSAAFMGFCLAVFPFSAAALAANVGLIVASVVHLGLVHRKFKITEWSWGFKVSFRAMMIEEEYGGNPPIQA